MPKKKMGAPLKYGLRTESHRVTLPADLWRKAEQAGRQNRSEGLARLLGYEVKRGGENQEKGENQ